MTLNKLVKILRELPARKTLKFTRKQYTVIACALDKKGKVLAIRTNDYKCSHPVQKHFAVLSGKPDSIFLHAEISALIASRKKVHKILVARIDSYGNPVQAKPCSICEKAIYSYGVKIIEYTK